MKKNIQGDFQICISVPLNNAKLHKMKSHWQLAIKCCWCVGNRYVKDKGYCVQLAIRQSNVIVFYRHSNIKNVIWKILFSLVNQTVDYF